MIFAQVFYSLTPGVLADTSDVAEIFFVAERKFLAAEPSRNDALPTRKVQHQFPYAVRRCDRTRCCGPGIDSFQDFHECRAVPCFAIEGAPELVDNHLDLGHLITLVQ